MRHGIAGNKLSRNRSLRRATLRDLAKATLTKQRICTTTAKAKEARKLVDKLITLGKRGTLADKRRAFAILCDHKIVSDLFGKTSPRFKNRVGGYTRIIKIGNRRGDNAELAFLELTEKEEVIVTKKPTTTSKKVKEVKDVDEVNDIKAASEQPKQVQQEQQSHPQPEKASGIKAGGKKLGGGLRKIFNRKSPEA